MQAETAKRKEMKRMRGEWENILNTEWREIEGEIFINRKASECVIRELFQRALSSSH